MKKILFLLEFFASGNCPMANILRQEVAAQAVLLSPDLSLQPADGSKRLRPSVRRNIPTLS